MLNRAAFFSLLVFMGTLAMHADAQVQLGTLPQYVSHQETGSNFYIAFKGKAAQIIADPEDWKGVIRTPGMHVLKVYMVDPELVLEQIVVNPDDHYPSYMGAPAIEHQ